MTDTSSSIRPEPSESVMSALGASIDGDVIRPTDDEYDNARAIWNGMIDRRPALIVRCHSAADVAEAVQFARTYALLVSVRGGGHGVSGNAICDGGIVIDLSHMTNIEVDAQRRTVRAEAGALLGDLDRKTQQYGLAVPAGTVTETGIAGLTLGGGLGWLMRKHGLTCDNVTGVDMVTADGEIIHATDATHPDLLWGLRGGGGNFGIVTAFEYRAAPVGPTVLAGFILHPISQAREFMEFYEDFAANAPDEVTTIAVLRIMPPVPSVPAELHGVRVAGTGVCYVGDLDEGERVLRPLREFGNPLSDSIERTRFVDHQAILDAGVPAGLLYYEKSENLPALSPDLIDVLVEHGSSVQSPFAFVGLFQMGGAVGRVDQHSTAFANRAAAYSLVISSGWEDPDESDGHMGWVRSFWNAIQPFSAGGAYINFMSHDEGQDRVMAAYGPEKYQRLVALKNTYDPTNFFRLNQNIRPTV